MRAEALSCHTAKQLIRGRGLRAGAEAGAKARGQIRLEQQAARRRWREEAEVIGVLLGRAGGSGRDGAGEEGQSLPASEGPRRET